MKVWKMNLQVPCSFSGSKGLVQVIAVCESNLPTLKSLRCNMIDDELVKVATNTRQGDATFFWGGHAVRSVRNRVLQVAKNLFSFTTLTW